MRSTRQSRARSASLKMIFVIFALAGKWQIPFSMKTAALQRGGFADSAS